MEHSYAWIACWVFTDVIKANVMYRLKDLLWQKNKVQSVNATNPKAQHEADARLISAHKHEM